MLDSLIVLIVWFFCLFDSFECLIFKLNPAQTGNKIKTYVLPSCFLCQLFTDHSRGKWFIVFFWLFDCFICLILLIVWLFWLFESFDCLIPLIVWFFNVWFFWLFDSFDCFILLMVWLFWWFLFNVSFFWLFDFQKVITAGWTDRHSALCK